MAETAHTSVDRWVRLKEIKTNPNNPRIIKDAKYRQLVQSLKDFPQMLELRPIVVNADMVILGGNMRYKAAKEAGMEEVPIKVAHGLTPEQEKEFIIKDNVGFGEWNWEDLANNWDAEDLAHWGLDLPVFAGEEDPEPEPDPSIQWFLNLRCDSEQHAQELYNRFIAEGYDVKIIT